MWEKAKIMGNRIKDSLSKNLEDPQHYYTHIYKLKLVVVVDNGPYCKM